MSDQREQRYVALPDLTELKGPAVIMMCGMPGSGKSHVAKRVAQMLDFTRFCADEIRGELGDAADQSHTPEAWRILHSRAKQALAEHQVVIVDAAYARPEDRKKDVQLYRSMGAKVVLCIHLQSSYRSACIRNRNRKRQVPTHVMQRMCRDLEDNPPTRADGFNDVIVIVNHDVSYYKSRRRSA